MTTTPTKAQQMLKARTTKDLIRDFIMTSTVKDQNIYTVRGWIMDELQRRQPARFNDWLENSADDFEMWAFFDLTA